MGIEKELKLNEVMALLTVFPARRKKKNRPTPRGSRRSDGTG